jgi:hypothetical protein
LPLSSVCETAALALFSAYFPTATITFTCNSCRTSRKALSHISFSACRSEAYK